MQEYVKNMFWDTNKSIKYHNMHLSNIAIVILLINVLTITNTSKLQQLPLWTWDCIDDKCVPTKATHDGKLQSLVTCNMLCTSFQFWPKPTGVVTISSAAVPVRADLFHLTILSIPSLLVREHFIAAFELFRHDLRKMENNTGATQPWYVVEIRLAINESGSDDPRLLFDTDESYQLRLTPNNLSTDYLIVEIISNSFCGARHALETLSQLVWLDPYIGSLLTMDAATVDDAPRFSYRGLMIDTVQNYISVDDIIRTLDVMAANKLNTFHWHASDSQGLSIHFNSLSQLIHYEPYNEVAMYSPDEVRTIVRQARVRGIRVLLEVDLTTLMCNAWHWGSEMRINRFLRCGNEPAGALKSEHLCREINLNNPHIYSIIEKIYAEIIQLTDVGDIFHLGGEDLNYCLQDLNSIATIELKLQFTRNILQCLESINKRLPNLTILWSTNLSDRIKIYLKTYIHKIAIQIRNVSWTRKYISGVSTIISHEDKWDLNSGYGSWDAESGDSNYNSWQRVYEHRPWSRSNMACLEGGEATVWSSTLSEGGLEARVWPRVAALGERLWSDPAEGATLLVQARLDVYRSRLRDHGIQTAPLWSMWCTQNSC